MDDKVALVTGASSGIGYELTKELANRGYDLVIASAGERLSGAAEEIAGAGTRYLRSTQIWRLGKESISCGNKSNHSVVQSTLHVLMRELALVVSGSAHLATASARS
jgi:NAD(P)-dependent dehydrogenase (short-subunit alcohol dehydrogenase family)